MAKQVVQNILDKKPQIETIASILNKEAGAPLKQSLEELEAAEQAHTAILECRKAIEKLVCSEHATSLLEDAGLNGLASALLGTEHKDSLQFANGKISARCVPYVSESSAEQSALSQVYGGFDKGQGGTYDENRARMDRIKANIIDKYKQNQKDSDAAQAAITALAMTLGGTSKTSLSTTDLKPIAAIIGKPLEERKEALEALWAERDKAEIAEFSPTINRATEHVSNVRRIINSDTTKGGAER